MKAIAIDFDGCLCDNAYPAIGAPHWGVIARAKMEQEAGAGLILWTCREGPLLQEAVAACESWGLHFDAINESLPSWIAAFKNAPRKVGASEYWDDRAVPVGIQPEMYQVIGAIGLPAVLEQCAEELAELTQAALKMARKLRGENPTPVTHAQARSICMRSWEMSACASRSWMSPWAEITPPPWRRKSSGAGWTD